MQKYFEATVKQLKIDQNGYEKKVSFQMLIEAVSFTDTETIINDYCDGSQFQITRIAPSKINDVISGDSDLNYKAKLQFVSIDEQSGKEKKFTEYTLINAGDIDQAKDRINKSIEMSLVPIEIKSIVETKIEEVLLCQ